MGVYSSEKTVVQEVSNQKRGWAFIQDGLIFVRVTDGIIMFSRKQVNYFLQSWVCVVVEYLWLMMIVPLPLPCML